jgi:hypothetical protein
MEVHSHTHTPRKKWYHYFWEFFMLFLAVTLGFFVENLREHTIEKDREKQFMKSLVNDLEADVAELNMVINNRAKKKISLDSLLFLLNSPQIAQYGNSIYYNAIYASKGVDIWFTPNNGTLQQLKNAGGLRLIRNPAVVDSITKYDVSVRNLITFGDLEESVFRSYRLIANKVFNSLVFDKMLDEENIAARPSENPDLLPFEKGVLNELNANIYTMKVINRGTSRAGRKLLLQATNLLGVLKKEYRLE